MAATETPETPEAAPIPVQGWRCPTCGRMLELAWPKGEPFVTIQAWMCFSSGRRDGTLTFEPAGMTPPVRMCQRCAGAAWPAIQKALGREGERWPG